MSSSIRQVARAALGAIALLILVGAAGCAFPLLDGAAPSSSVDPFLGTWRNRQPEAKLAKLVIAKQGGKYLVVFIDHSGSPYLRWRLPRSGNRLTQVVSVQDGALRLEVRLGSRPDRLRVEKGAAWTYYLKKVSDSTALPSPQ